MENYREQQMEALAMVSEYMDKLIPAMGEVCAELTGEMKEDTLEYLGQIIEAFNFVVNTFNVTRDIVNEKESLIVENELEKEINALSKAMMSKNYKLAGMIMSGSIIDFLKVYNARAKEIIG